MLIVRHRVRARRFSRCVLDEASDLRSRYRSTNSQRRPAYHGSLRDQPWQLRQRGFYLTQPPVLTFSTLAPNVTQVWRPIAWRTPLLV